MSRVLLSGRVAGENDPSRESRAQLLYLLFSSGWDISNSNGDQRVTLGNIQEQIIESDAFVFTQGATLEELFKAVSVFVGYQTLDEKLSKNQEGSKIRKQKTHAKIREVKLSDTAKDSDNSLSLNPSVNSDTPQEPVLDEVIDNT